MQTQRKQRISDLFAGCTVIFFLIWHLASFSWLPKPWSSAKDLWPVWLGLATLLFVAGRARKDKGLWFLAAFLVLLAVRSAGRNPSWLFKKSVVRDSVFGGVYALACYEAGLILSPRARRTLLRVVSGLWTAAISLLCCVGIWAMKTDTLIRNSTNGAYPLDGFIGLVPTPPRRLCLFVQPTVTGALLSLSGTVALGRALADSKKWRRFLFVSAWLLMLYSCSLSDSRTAFITLGFGSASLLAVRLFRGLSANDGPARRVFVRQPAGTFLCLAFIAAVTVCLVLAQLGMNKVSDNLFFRGGVAAAETPAEAGTAVPAEAPENAGLSGRGFTGSDPLTGRPVIWRNTIRYLMKNPKYLLAGTGLNGAMDGVNAMPDGLSYPVSHTHSTLLMILLESGLLGLLPVLGFVICFLRAAIRIPRSDRASAAEYLLPFPVLAVFLGETADCFLFLRNCLPTLTFTFLLLGMTAAAGTEIREKTSGRISSKAPSESIQKKGR